MFECSNCICLPAAFNSPSFCDKSNPFSCGLGYTIPMLKFLIGCVVGGFDDVVVVADFRSTVLLIADTSLTMIFGSGLVRVPVNVIDNGNCGVGGCIGFVLCSVVEFLVIDRLFSASVRLTDALVLDSGGLFLVDDGVLILTDGLLRAAIEGLPLALDKGLALAFDNGLARAFGSGLALATINGLPFDAFNEPLRLECVAVFW